MPRAKSSEDLGKVSSFICETHDLHMKDARPAYEGRTTHN